MTAPRGAPLWESCALSGTGEPKRTVGELRIGGVA